MDKSTQERLVGAVILVALVVLIVPALLTGPRAPEPADEPAAATRSVEIELVPKSAAPLEVADDALPEPPAAADAGRGSDETPAPAGEPVATPLESAPVVRPAKPAAAPPPPVIRPPAAVERPAAVAGGVWAAQVAALSRKDSAERLVGELRDRGYPAFVMEYRDASRVLYRVRVGPEQDRARADQLAARLTGEGYRAAVVAHP